MLKVALADEELRGNVHLANWQNGPFVQVLSHRENAVLMKRSSVHQDLVKMAQSDDAKATRILLQVADKIHYSEHPVDLEPLEKRFQDLMNAPSEDRLGPAKNHAKYLFEHARKPFPLHGDLHHGNILFFEDNGWLAIDPKGIWGERGFDFANLFCNPSAELALKPGRFEAQLQIISKISDIAPARLCRWVIAWTGLSAVWSMADGDDPRPAFKIGEIAEINLRELS